MEQGDAVQQTRIAEVRSYVTRHDAISHGGQGVVYSGEIEDPWQLILQRAKWGELNLAQLLGSDVDSDTKLRFDTSVRTSLEERAENQWKTYCALKKENPAQAHMLRADTLRRIDPTLAPDKRIALKVLRLPKDIAPEQAQHLEDRFVQENRLLQRLSEPGHPGVVRNYGLLNDPHLGYVMLLELLEGMTIEEYIRGNEKQNIKGNGALKVPKAIEVILSIAKSLKYCHDNNVQHRDIKPANIMLCPDGRYVLFDFGLGKTPDHSMTIAGIVMGTPQYMAPEQWEGKEATKATDVYLLSQTLYEMLTGEMPTTATNFELIHAQTVDLKVPHRRLRTHAHLQNISSHIDDLVEIGREKIVDDRWLLDEFIAQAELIQKEGLYEGLPEPRRSRTQLLMLHRVHRRRLKQIETSIYLIKKQDDVDTTRALFAMGKNEEALVNAREIAKELGPMPPAYNDLKINMMRLLVSNANAQFRSGSYLQVADTLEVIQTYLPMMPPDAQKATDAYNRLTQRFSAHKPMVDMLRMLRKSFIETIETGLKTQYELKEQQKAPEENRVKDLIGQVDAAEGMLVNIDRTKIGDTAYVMTQKELSSQRERLNKLLS